MNKIKKVQMPCSDTCSWSSTTCWAVLESLDRFKNNVVDGPICPIVRDNADSNNERKETRNIGLLMSNQHVNHIDNQAKLPNE